MRAAEVARAKSLAALKRKQAKELKDKDTKKSLTRAIKERVRRINLQ